MSRAQLPAAGEYARHVRHQQTLNILRSSLWRHTFRLTRCRGSRVVEMTCRCMNMRNYATPSQHKHAGLRSAECQVASPMETVAEVTVDC